MIHPIINFQPNHPGEGGGGAKGGAGVRLGYHCTRGGGAKGGAGVSLGYHCSPDLFMCKLLNQESAFRKIIVAS